MVLSSGKHNELLQVFSLHQFHGDVGEIVGFSHVKDGYDVRML